MWILLFFFLLFADEAWAAGAVVTQGGVEAAGDQADPAARATQGGAEAAGKQSAPSAVVTQAGIEVALPFNTAAVSTQTGAEAAVPFKVTTDKVLDPRRSIR
jgi:hypothetical protein